MLGEPKTTLEFLDLLFGLIWSRMSKRIWPKGRDIGPQFSSLNSGNKFVSKVRKTQ